MSTLRSQNLENQMHRNSLEAYDQLDTSTRQRQVLEAAYQTYRDLKVCTRQSLAERLGWPINRVTGRVTELLDRQLIYETGERLYVNGRPRAILKVSKELRERWNKN